MTLLGSLVPLVPYQRTFEPGTNIYSCMSKAVHLRLFAQDFKKWAAKKFGA